MTPTEPATFTPTERSPRARQVVAAARAIVEAEGTAALTMRRLGAALGIRAPSLYKHFPDKAAVEVALVEEVLAEAGAALHRAVDADAPAGSPVEALLAAYRAYGLAHPDLYRLATAGPLARRSLPAGLEDWAGRPFLIVAGDEDRARALWSLAHGMVILEVDGRYPPGAAVDRSWRAAAAAFGPRGGR